MLRGLLVWGTGSRLVLLDGLEGLKFLSSAKKVSGTDKTIGHILEGDLCIQSQKGDRLCRS